MKRLKTFLTLLISEKELSDIFGVERILILKDKDITQEEKKEKGQKERKEDNLKLID